MVVIEDRDTLCMAELGHCLGVTPPGHRIPDDDPVVSGENLGDAIFVTLREQFSAHTKILADPFWFRLRRFG